MVTLIGGDQLLERAHQAHLRARASTATPRDQFLLLADEAAEMGTATNGMRQPTRDQFSQIQELLKKKSKEESKLRKGVRGGMGRVQHQVHQECAALPLHDVLLPKWCRCRMLPAWGCPPGRPPTSPGRPHAGLVVSTITSPGTSYPQAA